MSHVILLELIRALHQEPILEQVNQFTPAEQVVTMKQLESIDPVTLKLQQSLLKQAEEKRLDKIEPLKNVRDASTIEDLSVAEDLLKKGQVGCILVAGGQGTRLGFDGPKGCFQITPALRHTLFHYISERVKGASDQAGTALRLAIMTSPLNDAATRQYFLDNEYFGLHPERVSFFVQGMLPFLNKQGEIFFESPGKIAFGPDGNGSCLHAFHASGIASSWEKAGVKYVTFILVDNPLADPFDKRLIAAHVDANADVTMKCIARDQVNEKVGVVVENNGKTAVLEYSEMPKKEWEEKNAKGELTYRIANLSLFCFNMSFINQVAKETLPLHKAFKAAQHLDQAGKIVAAKDPYAWKFERFIFDVLPYAKKTQAILYDRGDCFAPLKSSEDVVRVQEALTAYDRIKMAELTGNEAPEQLLEIDPAFYTPTERLKKLWHGRRTPASDYIKS